MIKVIKSLANVRAPQTTDCEIVATPGEGGLSINSNACAKLDIAKGDYFQIIVGEDTEGRKALYAAKGVDGGEKEPNVGAKLNAPNNRTGGSLNCSSANMWNELGGNTEKRRVYKMSETAETDENGNGAYFLLQFAREEDKMVRGAGEEEEVVATANA